VKIKNIIAGTLSTGSTAGLLQVNPATIARWIDRGKLPAFITAGGHRRINMRDVKAFSAKQSGQQPKPETFLPDLIKITNKTTDLHTLFKSIINILCSLPGISAGGIYLNKNNKLHLEYAKNLPPEFIKAFKIVPETDMRFKIVRRGRAVFIKHTDFNKRINTADESVFANLFILPFITDNNPGGCINLISEKLPSSPQQKEMFSAAAHITGEAVSRILLRQKSLELMNIFRNTDNMFCLINRKFKIVYINRSFRELSAVPAKKMIGKGIDEVIDRQQYVARVLPALKKCMAGSRCYYSIVFENTAGQKKLFDAEYFPIKIGSRTEQICAVIRNLSVNYNDKTVYTQKESA